MSSGSDVPFWEVGGGAEGGGVAPGGVPVPEPGPFPGRGPLPVPGREPAPEPVPLPGREPGQGSLPVPGREPDPEPLPVPGREPAPEPPSVPGREPDLGRWGAGEPSDVPEAAIPEAAAVTAAAAVDGAKNILVPRLTGMTLQQATETAEAEGFVTELAPLDREKLAAAGVNLATKPEGTVLAQTPPAATLLPAGGTITLRHLAPQGKKTGASSQKAGKGLGKNTIIGVGLAAAAAVMIAASVLGSPGDGTQAAPTPTGTPSPTASPTLPGNLTIAVPNVVGQDPSRAETLLTNSGFVIGQQLEQVVTENSGDVAAQAPAAGMPAERGSTVNLVIGVAKRGVPIPTVLEQAEGEAAAAIKAAGLTLVPSQTIDSDQPAGTVVQQLPSAGQLAPEGGRVLLLLSNGKKKMPNVIGLTEPQAASDLVALGLRVKVYSLKNTRQPAGTVVGQSPAEGGYVEEGGEVSITVSADDTPQPSATPQTGAPAPAATPAPPEPGQPSAAVIPNPGTE